MTVRLASTKSQQEDHTMKKKQILEAWRNEEYYRSLSDEERAQVPEHPSGVVDVEDDILRSITGGCGTFDCTSGYCSPCPPAHCY